MGRSAIMIFYSFLLKSMMGKVVTVELKNDLQVRGTLISVDQYLNVKLDNVSVNDEDEFPHLMAVRNCFIRGSVIRLKWIQRCCKMQLEGKVATTSKKRECQIR